MLDRNYWQIRKTLSTEPTQRGDEIAEYMREYYEANKPKGFFARRREKRYLDAGCSDDLMIGLSNVAIILSQK